MTQNRERDSSYDDSGICGTVNVLSIRLIRVHGMWYLLHKLLWDHFCNITVLQLKFILNVERKL